MKASDNPFPSLLIEEAAAPAAPAAGHQRLFIDPVDHLLKAIDSTGAITTIGGTTTGGGGGATGFHDDFVRADALLDGNNGWFKAVGNEADVADLKIVSNELVLPTGSVIDFGNHPMLHLRNSVDPAVADVTMRLRRNTTAGNGGLCVCSDDTGDEMLWVYFDGSDHTSAGAAPNVIQGGSGSVGTWDNDYANWAAFSDNVTVMNVRVVYDNATSLLQVYQGATLCYDLNVNAALTTYFGSPTTYADLSTQPNCGIMSNAGENVETILDFLSV